MAGSPFNKACHPIFVGIREEIKSSIQKFVPSNFHSKAIVIVSVFNARSSRGDFLFKIHRFVKMHNRCITIIDKGFRSLELLLSKGDCKRIGGD